MTAEEQHLIVLANNAEDKIANKAMKELRERFDETYIWCLDCDCMVVKEKDCCLNRLSADSQNTDMDLF